MGDNEVLPDINISAIAPAIDESQISCKNTMENIPDCMDAKEENKRLPLQEIPMVVKTIPNRKSIVQDIDEPIIERFSEEASETIEQNKGTPPKIETVFVNGNPIQIPFELMNNSQESLCKTEEKELEEERQKFVTSIEQDLNKRGELSQDTLREKCNQNRTPTATVESIKKTARFACPTVSESNSIPIFAQAKSEEITANSSIYSSKKPAVLKENSNPPTFRNINTKKKPMTERGNIVCAYNEILQKIQKKKNKIEKLKKLEFEQRKTLASLKANKINKKIESKIDSAKTRLETTKNKIVMLEKSVNSLVKLARQEVEKITVKSKLVPCPTSRQSINQENQQHDLQKNKQSLEKKYSHILQLKNKLSIQRSLRSYTMAGKLNTKRITGKNLISFISTKNGSTLTNTYSMDKSRKDISHIQFKNNVSLFSQRNPKDLSFQSLCNQKETIEFLLVEYRKVYGHTALDKESLIKFWKSNISSNALVLF